MLLVPDAFVGSFQLHKDEVEHFEMLVFECSRNMLETVVVVATEKLLREGRKLIGLKRNLIFLLCYYLEKVVNLVLQPGLLRNLA